MKQEVKATQKMHEKTEADQEKIGQKLEGRN